MNVPPYKSAAAPSPYVCFLRVAVGRKKPNRAFNRRTRIWDLSPMRPELARDARSEQNHGLSLPHSRECVGLTFLDRDALFSRSEIQVVRFQNDRHEMRSFGQRSAVTLTDAK